MQDTIHLQHRISAAFANIPSTTRWWIAYSGGLDSHCLLHFLATRAADFPELNAIHIDHGLHPQASEWALHCVSICEQLGINCHVVQVAARANSGESREAAARTARYQALGKFLAPGEVLITAHHQNDQAETFILQLLRGAGVRGLAAMPSLINFQSGYLARPLLNFSRTELHSYAQEYKLQWIEDDSNYDSSYDRNYLRQKIMPLLYARWPSAAQTISRSAIHQSEAELLLEQIAVQDFNVVRGNNFNTLQVDLLLQLSAERARNLIRYWLRTCGHPIPSTIIIEKILEIAAARWDATPLITWEDTELRRYRNLIYLMSALPSAPQNFSIEWRDISQSLILPGGILRAQRIENRDGIATRFGAPGFTIRFRRGGEKCRRGSYLRPLKDLWQQCGIPPWERIRTPLLFIGTELAVVPGIGVCHPFQNISGEPAWEIEWQQIRNIRETEKSFLINGEYGAAWKSQ